MVYFCLISVVAGQRCLSAQQTDADKPFLSCVVSVDTAEKSLLKLISNGLQNHSVHVWMTGK